MNRSRWSIAGALLVLVVVAGAWMRSRPRQDEPKYRTASVERGDITSTVSATGSVEPVLQVQVGSQVSGTLAKLNVDFNSHVRAGQVLGQLETSAFRARLAQAEAAVARAEAALKDARRQFARTKELVAGNFVSQADADAAEVLVEQRQADLKQARATLESAQVDLDHTTIRSPIDGVVISRSIDVGQTVAASLQAPQLFVIANDLRNMQVETKIDEADIGRIRPGLPVRFTVDAFPDLNFEGTVTQVRLQPLTESNVVTYTTVISTRNEELLLRPGMTANATVLVETRADVLQVPNAALRFRPAGAGGGNGGGRNGRGVAEGGDRRAVGAGTGSGGAGRAAAVGAGAAGGERSARGEGLGGAAARGRPGAVYVLRGRRPARVGVLSGITDGSMTEVRADSLRAGDEVIVGLERPKAAAGNLAPPPGMGGPPFRGPGGGRR